MKFFEDLQPGQTFHTEGITITEEAIIRFGLEWDFQPFHVDKVAAKSSLFGGLISSGLLTMLVTFRLCVQANIFSRNAVAGLGFKEVRFPSPVYPGNTLRVAASVGPCRRSKSKPDLGIVNWRLETRDETQRLVCSMELSNMVRCRTTPA